MFWNHLRVGGSYLEHTYEWLWKIFWTKMCSRHLFEKRVFVWNLFRLFILEHFENDFFFERTSPDLKIIRSHLFDFRISAQKYLNRVLIQHFPFFLVRVSYWGIRKPLIRNFEKRHVLEKQLNELSLKHLYKSVSLLNDISRNVQNIDYTRDMSWEEYFWIFWFYIVFEFFENFLFLYFVFVGFSNFVFCFSKIFTAKLFER